MLIFAEISWFGRLGLGSWRMLVECKRDGFLAAQRGGMGNLTGQDRLPDRPVHDGSHKESWGGRLG